MGKRDWGGGVGVVERVSERKERERGGGKEGVGMSHSSLCVFVGMYCVYLMKLRVGTGQ